MKQFICEYCGDQFKPETQTPEYNVRGEEKTLWFCSQQCNDDWWAHYA